jgi:DNA adenine methylase
MLPMVRWVGGKRKIVSHLLALAPPGLIDGYTYYEPFLGGGSLFLAHGPRRAVLGDLNWDLVNFYRQVQRVPDRVAGTLASLGSVIDRLAYYHIRDTFNCESDAVRRAAYFMALNLTSFNGIWRVNVRGEFNVPYGDRGRIDRFDSRRLQELSGLLRDVELFHGDFEQCVSGAAAGDFVYLDPPYMPITTAESFTRYTGAGFGEDEHKAVARVFAELVDRGCYVMLTQANVPLVHELFAQYRIVVLQGARVTRARGSHLIVEDAVVLGY